MPRYFLSETNGVGHGTTELDSPGTIPPDDDSIHTFVLSPEVNDDNLLDYMVHTVAYTPDLQEPEDFLIRVADDGTGTVWNRPNT
jgi:hypothetical protein